MGDNANATIKLHEIQDLYRRGHNFEELFTFSETIPENVPDFRRTSKVICAPSYLLPDKACPPPKFLPPWKNPRFHIPTFIPCLYTI